MDIEQQYLKLLTKILKNGVQKKDRTKIGTYSLFGEQLRHDLSEGFPLFTTKKVHLKSIIHELLWFLKGDTNIQYLKENNVSIWNEWADNTGCVGKMYGYQWTKANGLNQIQKAIDLIRHTPDSRRIIVSAWNVAELENMALEPCHILFQFYVANGKLSCQVYQRSCDMFLGVPFNIASYSLLTMMIAQITGLELGELIWAGGDVHIYTNHVKQVKEQISRKPYALPTMEINPKKNNIFEFEYSDFKLLNYKHHKSIKAEVAV